MFHHNFPKNTWKMVILGDYFPFGNSLWVSGRVSSITKNTPEITFLFSRLSHEWFWTKARHDLIHLHPWNGTSFHQEENMWKNSERFGHHDLSWLFFCRSHTVDGSEILHQLRLVVYPSIKRVLYIPGGAAFLPSTVQRSCLPTSFIFNPSVRFSLSKDCSTWTRPTDPCFGEILRLLKMEGHPFNHVPIIKPSKEWRTKLSSRYLEICSWTNCSILLATVVISLCWKGGRISIKTPVLSGLNLIWKTVNSGHFPKDWGLRKYPVTTRSTTSNQILHPQISYCWGELNSDSPYH